jgi:hypothetical protein
MQLAPVLLVVLKFKLGFSNQQMEVGVVLHSSDNGRVFACRGMDELGHLSMFGDPGEPKGFIAGFAES